MIITYRVHKGNVKEYDIKSSDDLVSFMNEVLKPKNPWISISKEVNDHFQCMYESNETYTVKYWNMVLSKPLKIYSNVRTIDYWLVRGYSLEEAKCNITLIQSNAGQTFANKVKENPADYSTINPTQIGYWLKQGYNEEDAKLRVKERQQTFTLDKCILNLGIEEGTKRFNDRNAKWLNSRKISLDNGLWDLKDQGTDKNSLKYFYNTFKDMWILHHIDYISKSKRVSKEYLSELKNLHKIIYEENSLDEFLFNLSFDEIIHISKNTILQFFLSKSNIEIVSNWCKLKNIKFKQNNRGNQYWYNGYFFKSNHEFSIGKYLIDSNVRFKANLRYPGLSYYYDFYLEDHDLYVEYMGMRDKDYTKKIKKLKSSLFNIAWIKTINELKLIINEKNYKQ